MKLTELLHRHGFQVPEIDATCPSGLWAAVQAWIAGTGVSEEAVLTVVAKDLGIDQIDLTDRQIDRELIERFPAQELFRFSILPLEIACRGVLVAISDPYSHVGLDELSAATGLALEPVLACRSQIEFILKRELGVGGGTIRDMVSRDGGNLTEDAEHPSGADLDDPTQASSVIKLVNEFLKEAVSLKASDIHIEPEVDGLRIRYRVDGVLVEHPVAAEVYQYRRAIASRLKILAQLNIAEKRLPQDGRIKLSVAGREVDVRVSIIPMLHGEGIVMRLLDKSKSDFDLSSVQMPEHMKSVWKQLIRRPHGMVLVTGPTGSGKTTTLYSSLAEIRNSFTKIITIEDPVEYELRGINQIQAQSKLGLTFSAALRSILRHDPDVILIGEIRDSETAINAIQASLTGHAVLSTLHTNDAPSAFIRLVDMGIEPYLVAGSLEGVLAQRLVRRLCPACKAQSNPDPQQAPEDFLLAIAGTSDTRTRDSLAFPLYRPVGCRDCHQTGYSGRVGIYELLVTDSLIRQLCNQRASSDALRAHAIEAGMMTLRQSGWQRVIEGATSVEEVLRVCADDSDGDGLISTNSSPVDTVASILSS